MLTGYPITFEETIDALLCMDQTSESQESLLTEDIIDKLLKIKPNPEEIEACRSFAKSEGDINNLRNDIEAFVFSLSNVEIL